jgi:hypothetical protein
MLISGFHRKNSPIYTENKILDPASGNLLVWITTPSLHPLSWDDYYLGSGKKISRVTHFNLINVVVTSMVSQILT